MTSSPVNKCHILAGSMAVVSPEFTWHILVRANMIPHTIAQFKPFMAKNQLQKEDKITKPRNKYKNAYQAHTMSVT